MILDMHQAEVRCLNLWNGSSNNLPPSGWQTIAFDDSAWGFSAVPTVAGTMLWDGIGTSTIPAGGPEALWPTTTMQSDTQQAVFRWHFNLPSTYAITNMATWLPGDSDPLSMANEAYVSGVFVGSGKFSDAWGFSAFQKNVRMHAVGVAGDNVLALLVTQHGSPVAFWGSTAWWTMRIEMDAKAGRSFAQVVG